MRTIEYPSALGIPVTAEFLTADEAAFSAHSLMEIIEKGYTAEFESKTASLKPGTVAARYSPRLSSNVLRYSERTRTHYRLGSEIVAVRSRYPGYPRQWQAFSKISPAPAMTGDEFDGCYINDIIARPPHGFGWGRVVLHAALRWSSHANDERVVLEAFTGSSVNKWYEHLGLQPLTDKEADPFPFNDAELPMTWYATPPGSCLHDVVKRLEEHNPGLRNSYEYRG